MMEQPASELPADLRPSTVPVYAVRCMVCTRHFPPNEYARAQWNRNLEVAIPMACPHCRATGVYRFDSLSLRSRLWP
jgi:hypothetical protein